PMAAVLADPVGHVPERLRRQPAGAPLRVPALFDEPRALEHIEMLRDRREAEVEWSGELGDRGIAAREPGENGSACRIGEGRERRAEGVCRGLHFTCRLINLSG